MKLISITILVLCIWACSDRKSTINTGKEGRPMPVFDMLLMDSISHINTNKIPTGKPTVVFLFSPNCPFCRAQTEDIINNINTVSNIQFYMISQLPFEQVQKYYNKYQFAKYPNITLAIDPTDYFGNFYKAPGVPYIAIYDKEKKLKKALIGKVKTNLIKEIAFE